MLEVSIILEHPGLQAAAERSAQILVEEGLANAEAVSEMQDFPITANLAAHILEDFGVKAKMLKADKVKHPEQDLTLGSTLRQESAARVFIPLDGQAEQVDTLSLTL